MRTEENINAPTFVAAIWNYRRTVKIALGLDSSYSGQPCRECGDSCGDMGEVPDLYAADEALPLCVCCLIEEDWEFGETFTTSLERLTERKPFPNRGEIMERLAAMMAPPEGCFIERHAYSFSLEKLRCAQNRLDAAWERTKA